MSHDQVPSPTVPASFTWKTMIVSSGFQYLYIDQCSKSEASSEVVLFLHGFPDLAFGWRYQIIDFIKHGYRAIAPDLLGYGGTSKPTDVEAYTKLNSCKALVEILKHENIQQKVIVVGHDWGSALASRFVQYFPEKVRCWATLCVPPSRPGQRGEPPLDFELLFKTRLSHQGYQKYLMSPEFSQEINQHCKTLILLLYLHADRNLDPSIYDRFSRLKNDSFVGENVLQKQIKEVWHELDVIEVNDPEIKYFISEFEKGGMLGPVSWYKTGHIDHSDEQAAALPSFFSRNIPCLFIGASNDPAFPPSQFSEKTKKKLFPTNNLTCEIIQGGNHFMHQDPLYREEVTKVMRDWIDRQIVSRNLHVSHL